jgi:hypothetical protein
MKQDDKLPFIDSTIGILFQYFIILMVLVALVVGIGMVL